MNLDESLARLRQFIVELHETPRLKDEKLDSFAEILQGGTYFEHKPDGALALAGAEQASYRKCLHDISEIATKKELISKGTVETHVQNAILKALNTENQTSSDFDRRLSNAVTELKKPSCRAGAMGIASASARAQRERPSQAIWALSVLSGG